MLIPVASHGAQELRIGPAPVGTLELLSGEGHWLAEVPSGPEDGVLKYRVFP